MKTSKLINLVGALASTMTMATMAHAAGLQNQAEMNAELAKAYRTKEGIEIRYAPKESVNNILNKLDGQATVEFGKDKQLKFLKTGGVIVGSGADGLVATGNVNNNNQVVAIPLNAKMSLTVVGASEDYNFCVSKIQKNSDGTVARGKSDIATRDGQACQQVGTPFRLKEAGTYLVYLGNKNFGRRNEGSEMMVDIAENENKVIPVRKLTVPYVTGHADVKFKILRDFESSDIEKEKVYLRYFASSFYFTYPCVAFNATICSLLPSVKTIAELKRLVVISKADDEGNYINFKAPGHPELVPVVEQNFTYTSGDSYDQYEGYQVAGPRTFAVLPGVYRITWLINGQTEITKGIYVQ